MVSPNPQSYNNEQERKRRAVATASVGFGWVTDNHPKVNEVTVQPFGMPQSFQANVAVEMDGSLAIPDEAASQDLRAIYAKLEGEKPVVLGFFYDSEIHDIPDTAAGERKIGHQSSETELYFRADGSLEISSDSNLILNGGTQGAIYDIKTTTDVDGHVTGITPQRRSDILI